MKNLFRSLHAALTQGQDAVLVTVVASSGSTPRGAGARMLITKDGRIAGTIGGGAVEYRSEQLARTVLAQKSSRMEYFQLRKNQVEDLGMICGGDVNVYFQYIPAGDPRTLSLTDRILTLYARGEQSWLITDITPEHAGGLAVYGKKSGLFGAKISSDVIPHLGAKPDRIQCGQNQYYCEKLIQAGMVCIFGGGHVAQALVPALSAVDFRCTVLEDREDFCRKELFPQAEETILIDNTRIADFITIREDDYVVIMTRGHKDDTLIQAQALKTPARYIGVIGSARKTAGVFAILREQGFTDQDLSRITTPIGLDIGSETPAEIAVSITAQLIQVRAARNHS